MEKFFNIKCRESGLTPKCAVIVATVRALKMHGGGPPVSAGKPLAKEYTEENIPLVVEGYANLCKHIENAKKFGVQVVVAINQFKSDTAAEMEAIRKASMEAGAYDAVVSNHWAEGGKGAEALGRAVIAACSVSNSEDFKYLYDLELPIREKVEIISKEIYGADGVDFSELAEQQMAQYEGSGFGNLPSKCGSLLILHLFLHPLHSSLVSFCFASYCYNGAVCIAKTQYSFSCDAAAKGVPTGFRIFVREIRSCVGAGFLYPICGDIMTIPGLPTRPGFYDVDIDTETGQVIGLF